MFQWDDVIDKDNALDYSLVTGASGSGEKREPKTEEYISPEEIQKADLFDEEAEKQKRKLLHSKDSRANKAKQICLICHGDGTLLERTCPKEGCFTGYFVHRTCNRTDLDCGNH